jgi:hypothetical protein
MAMHSLRWPILLPVLLPALLLGGCLETAAAVGAVSVAAVPLIGRTLPDVAVSAVTGKDCSLVRLDAGKTYCADEEKAPEQQVVCTRSLGVVDCWRNPKDLGVAYTEVADGPRALTPAQEANRTRKWHGLW